MFATEPHSPGACAACSLDRRLACAGKLVATGRETKDNSLWARDSARCERALASKLATGGPDNCYPKLARASIAPTPEVNVNEQKCTSCRDRGRSIIFHRCKEVPDPLRKFRRLNISARIGRKLSDAFALRARSRCCSIWRPANAIAELPPRRAPG